MTTTHPDGANVTIVPMVSDSLEIEILKGQDDPVQGWANDPWRPTPTAVFTQSGSGTTWSAYVLYPTRPGQVSPVSSVTSFAMSDSALGLTVERGDESDVILISLQPGQEAEIGDYTTDAEAAVARNGSNSDAFLVGGSVLKRNGQAGRRQS